MPELGWHEWRHGNTFSKTSKKFGRKKARKQMVAVMLNKGRKKSRR